MSKRSNPPISHDLFAGTMGGCFGLLVSHPMDLVKVRMQVGGAARYGSILETIRDTVRNEGAGGFYKGIAPPLVTAGAVNAVVFTVYGGTLRYLERDMTEQDRRQDSTLNKMGRLTAAASLAGLATCFISTPVELIKCQQQINTKQAVSTMDMARSIVRKHGNLGIFRGWWATVGRDVPAFTLYFLTYEVVKDALASKPSTTAASPTALSSVVLPAVVPLQDDSFVIMTAGAVAGISAWVFVYPIDTVKSMVQTDTSRKGLGSWTSLMMRLHREHGAGNGPLWRGFGAMLCRTMPMNAVTFLVYERTMSYMSTRS